MRALLDAAALRLEQSGRRTDIVLAAPERLNAQLPSTWNALAAATQWLDGRTDVVVVRGEGRSFSAGLDRRAFTPEGVPGELGLLELGRRSEQEIADAIAFWQLGFTGFASGSFVSIAAVQGHAIGAGFQLALACDLRVAADDARFAMREPALGIVPDLAGTKPLVDAVGYARALEICATGRFVEAAEAQAIGLVQQVVPVQGLGPAVDALVDAVLASNPGAVAATKTLLRGAQGRDLDAQREAERVAQAAILRSLAAQLGGAPSDGG